MKKLFLVISLFFSTQALLAEVTPIGQESPSLCYNSSNFMPFCTDDFEGRVQVLIYNAGWCGPCNTKMRQIVSRVQEFEGEPVQFVSISAEGWSRGSRPDAQFLTEWRDKFNIPFIVTGGHRDFGKHFQTPPLYIPFVAVLDMNKRLRYKTNSGSVDELFQQVRQLISRGEN